VEKKLFCLDKFLGKRLADDGRVPLVKLTILPGKKNARCNNGMQRALGVLTVRGF
jgi:hypothetical protein